MGYINPALAVYILLLWVSKSGKTLEAAQSPHLPYATLCHHEILYLHEMIDENVITTKNINFPSDCDSIELSCM